MKDRRATADSWEAEIIRLDSIIIERFKTERHPEASVDGDDRWGYDPFEEGE